MNTRMFTRASVFDGSKLFPEGDSVWGYWCLNGLMWAQRI